MDINFGVARATERAHEILADTIPVQCQFPRSQHHAGVRVVHQLPLELKWGS